MPTGLLVLEFPSTDSLSFEVLNDYWHWIMAPYHLFHFNRKSMRFLLESKGFHVLGWEASEVNWMWAESIANSSGFLNNYLNKWRCDSDFVEYSMEVDKCFDFIANGLGKQSVLQVYACLVE